MDTHIIELPGSVIIGNGVIRKAWETCEKVRPGVKNVLVVTGRTTKKVAGDNVRGALEDKGIQVDVSIASEASVSAVGKMEKKGDWDIIIGVGGGKAIDIAKLLGFRKGVPFISIPTAPSHDGIASERVSLKNGDRRESFKARPPVSVIADISILRKAPQRLVSAGAADVISNYTSVYDWELGKKQGEYFADYSANLALLSSQLASASAEEIGKRSEKGVRDLVEALVSSGISMSIAGTSRPASGSEHAFAHALEVLGSKAYHGEQAGIGSILMAYWQGNDWKSIKKSLEKAGAPVTAGQIGEDREMIVNAMLMAKGIRERFTILNKKPLTRKSAINVCRETGVS